MPKIAKERTQENQHRIEAAALELFITQGFHGTNNRDIAQKIGTSTGNIYTYFPSKEAIFDSLAKKYQAHLDEWRRKALRPVKNPLSKEGIKAMASAIQAAMYEEPEHFLLVLSDIIEFKNRHFLKVFNGVPQQLRRVMGTALNEARSQPHWRGHDPDFVLASMYTYFFTYFLMERYMQGEQHLGVSDDEATEAFIDMLLHGLWRLTPEELSREAHKKTRNDVGRQRSLYQAERERIAYIRFLSGRLWNLPPDLPPTQESDGKDPSHRPILFLPELPKYRIDENQLRIEAAALEFFTKQGFHGTNIRDVAEKAGVSQGAIYSYYPSKEAIFEGLVKSYRHAMRKFLERVFRSIVDPFSERDLRFFAAAMRSMVYDDAEYWLLMYIDVVEFRNRHFLTAFQDVPGQFRRLLGPALDTVRKQPGWCGLDPALAMSMIFFYFHTYFVIERVMHGNRHLGVSDDEVVERFVDILSHGLLDPARQESTREAHRGRAHQEPRLHRPSKNHVGLESR